MKSDIYLFISFLNKYCMTAYGGRNCVYSRYCANNEEQNEYTSWLLEGSVLDSQYKNKQNVINYEQVWDEK